MWNEHNRLGWQYAGELRITKERECEVHWLWGGRIVREVDRDGPTKKHATERTVREKQREREVAGKWRGEWRRRIEGSEERDGRGNGGGERKRGRQGVAYSGKRLQVVLSGPKVHGGGRAGEQVSQACMCLSLTWISFCLHSFTVASGFCPSPLLKHTLPHTASLMPPTPLQTYIQTHTRTRTHTHARMHAHTHARTHTHTHTHIDLSTHFYENMKDGRATKIHNAYIIIIMMYRPSFFEVVLRHLLLLWKHPVLWRIYLQEICR